MAEVMLFGEPMVMFVAETAQPLEDVEMFRRSLAGAELNVAIGLVRLGHSAAYCTKLGTDPFGKYAEKKIRSEGIEAQVSYDSRYWTGFQLKNRVSEGDPEVVYFRENSAASHMTVEDVDQLDFKEAKILHITGIPPALSRSCLEATCHLIETARSNGMLVSFDPNLRPSLWESRSDQYKKHCPGFRVEHVVDTVGAGDGFAVGVLSALLEGLSPEEAAIRGNAIGAIQVSVRSDNEGLPNRAELESFIANNRS